MNNKIKAAITAVDGYVPPNKLTNSDLEKMVDTNSTWILERTGILERGILPQGTPSSDMGTKVLKGLCEKRGISPELIDMVIVATATPDYPCPANANLIAHKAGAKNAASFDLNAACSGFIYALSVGAQFIETGKYKKVAVIGMDQMSSIIDYQDRNTCVIFGDGAAGVLLEPDQEGVQDFILHSDGSGEEFLQVPAGGSLKPITHEVIDDRSNFLKQDGKVVFKYAVNGMVSVTKDIMEANNLTANQLNWLVPHQANLRIIEKVGEQLKIEPEKVIVNIEKYGNTTAATIPLCLYDYENKFKKGDNIILVAFGAGFTWGAVYLKWMY